MKTHKPKLAMFSMNFCSLFLFVIVLGLTITSKDALAASVQIVVNDFGQYQSGCNYNPDDGGDCPYFYPNGMGLGQNFSINVGDVVNWVHGAFLQHWIQATPAMGDWLGHTCQETLGDPNDASPNGGYMITHEDSYHHQFQSPGDCYYRCNLMPPMAGYPGMNGLISVSHGPTANSLTPALTISAPGVPQSFTAVYTDPDGFMNISDASVHITDLAGGPNNEWAHYNPGTNSFTLTGAVGSCSPGGSGSLMTTSMALNCSTSTASGSGTNLTIVFNLTAQPSFSGPLNSMFITVTDQSNATNGKIGAYWIVDRPPSANSITPVNLSTSVGTAQSFTAGFSDADGYQNISDAGLYLAAGPHNEWVHYGPTANKFTLTGANGSCSPGQAMTLSNGAMTLNCAASSASGSGTTLSVTYNLTPLAPSAGAQFLQVPAGIDSAGKIDGKIFGTWNINSF